MTKELKELFGSVEFDDLSKNRNQVEPCEAEKIYQTLKDGIDKLREMRHPNAKESPVCVMVSNPYAINIILAHHGKYLDKNNVIRVRFWHMVKQFFGLVKE